MKGLLPREQGVVGVPGVGVTEKRYKNISMGQNGLYYDSFKVVGCYLHLMIFLLKYYVHDIFPIEVATITIRLYHILQLQLINMTMRSMKFIILL